MGLRSENGIKVIGYAITDHDIGAMLQRVPWLSAPSGQATGLPVWKA